MKEFFKNSWKYTLPLFIGLIIGLLINIPSCQKGESKIEYIPVHDTITITKDRIVSHTKIKYVQDTLLQVDTIVIFDDGKQYAHLPIVYKEYNDTIKSDSAQAIVNIQHHGVLSDIDSININYSYFKERETIIQKPKKWGIDITAGPYIGGGYNIGKTCGPGFEVGIGVMVGVSYRLTK